MLVETAPDFEVQVKRLEKVYRLIHQDVGSLIADLQDGVRPQDSRLPNVGDPHVYKARLPNSSARRGTRGGFRVVYRIKLDTIILLLIWSKTQVSDIPASEIRNVVSRN